MGVGAQVMQRGRDFHPGSAVDGGVVHLGKNGEAARRVALDLVQALDDIHFPEGAAAVQGTGVQACHLDAQLAPVSRGRQCDMTDMKLRIKAAVRDPIGVVKPQRHGQQVSGQDRQALDPVGGVLDDFLEAHLAARRR